MSHEKFAAKVILQYLHAFNQYHRRLCVKGDELSVHQMRVNARRLRNALKTFKQIFPKNKIKLWNKMFKVAAKYASGARDLDVYIAFLKSYRNQVKGQQSKQQVNELIRSLRKKRHQLALQVIQNLKKLKEDKEFINIKKDIDHLLVKSRTIKAESLYTSFRNRIAHISMKIIGYDQLVRSPKNIDDLHQMRIEAKHLRYTLESIESIYDKKIHTYMSQVLKFHRILGEIHDYDVWMGHINDYKSEYKVNMEMMKTMNGLMSYCRHMRRKRYYEFINIWDQTIKGKFFTELIEFAYAHEN